MPSSTHVTTLRPAHLHPHKGLRYTAIPPIATQPHPDSSPSSIFCRKPSAPHFFPNQSNCPPQLPEQVLAAAHRQLKVFEVHTFCAPCCRNAVRGLCHGLDEFDVMRRREATYSQNLPTSPRIHHVTRLQSLHPDPASSLLESWYLPTPHHPASSLCYQSPTTRKARGYLCENPESSACHTPIRPSRDQNLS